MPILLWKFFEKYQNSSYILNFKKLIILILFLTKRDLLSLKIEIKSRILFLEIKFHFRKILFLLINLNF